MEMLDRRFKEGVASVVFESYLKVGLIFKIKKIAPK